MLEFLAPKFLLLFLPVILGLIYAYLQRGKAKKRIVSSLLLLETLRKRAKAKSKVKLPFRFFFELLFLSILILAVSGLNLNFVSQKVLIFIDNSLSMSAKYRELNSVVTVYDKAKSELLDNIEITKSLSNKYKICLSVPNIKCLSDNYQSIGSIKAQLEKIKIYRAKDNLSIKLSEISSKQDYSTLFILSDKKFKYDDTNRIKQISGRNQFLGNIAIGEVFLSSSDKELIVEVNSYQNISTTGVLDIKLLRFESGNIRQEKTLEQKLKIEPNFNKFSIPYQENYIYHLKVNRLNISEDAIAEDNEKWFYASKKTSNKVLLVKDTKEELNLDQILKEQILQVSLNEYEQKFKNDLYKSIIFYKTNPKQYPLSSSLFITPLNSGILRVSPLDNPDITLWNQNLEVLKYLTINDFNFQKVISASLPSWFQNGILSNNQSILSIGNKDELKFVYLGFNPLPFLGKEKKAEGIIILNIIKWLLEENINNSEFYAPTMTALESGIFYYYEDESLKELKISKGDIFEKEGVFINKAKEITIIKFFDNQESNLQNFDELKIELTNSNTDKDKAIDNFVSFLILFVLLLFLLGIFIWRKE